MKLILIIVTFGILFNLDLLAQGTIILQPGLTDGKDAEIWSLKPNSVYENNLVRGVAWTFQGEFGIVRGFLQFDLSAVPPGSMIDSAYLSLYSPDPPNTQFHSGDNAAFLRRITSDWGESSVSWNDQPRVTPINQVRLSASSEDYQDFLMINVTGLVQDMVLDPSNSFGFMLILEDESIFHRLSFCASEYPDPTKHPKLIVHYSPKACKSLVLQPGAEGKDAEVFSLQPDNNYSSSTYRGLSWTFQGFIGDIRGLLDFDLSALPQHATIDGAYLSLFSPDPPHTEFHSGNNTALLQRITSPWSEDEVNWNNQPSTITDHQVIVEASLENYQDYTNIDITQLVKDMRAEPDHSFGLMLRQVNEEPYRRLSFCSSDYANASKHPKLEICYSIGEPHTNEADDVLFFPNPFNEWIKVKLNGQATSVRLQVIDVLGRILFDQYIDPVLIIDMSYLTSGFYVIRCFNENNELLGKAKMVKP